MHQSNSAHFPIGLELEEPTFGMLLERLEDVSTPAQGEVPAFLTLPDTPAALELSLSELVAQAEGYGVDRAKLLLAARSYPKVTWSSSRPLSART